MNLYTKRTPPPLSEQGKEKHKSRSSRLFLLLMLGIGAMAYWLFMDAGGKQNFIIIKDGEPELAPWRKEKLRKELEDLEDAEQYVLIAGLSDWYPCYNCNDNKFIFLQAGEVWKYGVTVKGEKQRYRSGLPAKELVYLMQFRGPLHECLKKEKIKIYNYAILPENLKRTNPLIRPPGNKVDR